MKLKQVELFKYQLIVLILFISNFSFSQCNYSISPSTHHKWVDMSGKMFVPCSYVGCDSTTIRRSTKLQIGSQIYKGGFGDTSSVATRSYLKFDFFFTTANSCSLSKAKLKLNFTGNSVDSHKTTSGSNDFYISRVVDKWGEDTLRWKKVPSVAQYRMPLTTKVGRIKVSGTTVGDEDYSIDVTSFLSFWRQYPDSNFGLEIRLVDESGDRSLTFASANHPNPSLHPSIDFIVSKCSKNNADAGKDESICQGSSTELNARYGEFFKWNNDPTLSNLYVNNPVANPKKTTTYYLETTLGSCTSTDSIIVTVLEYPKTIVNTKETICFKDSVQLNSSGATTYSWSPNARIINRNTENPVVYPIVTTSYYLTSYDVSQCKKVDTVLVTVNPLTPTNAGKDISLCEGTSAQLLATGGKTYKWINGASTLNKTNIANPIASPKVTTTYSVEASNGLCPITDEITITVFPKFTVEAGNDIVLCKGDTAFLQGQTGFKTYQWTPSARFVKSTVSNPYILNTSSTEYLKLTVTDDNGCFSKDSLLMTVNKLPYLEVGKDTFVCMEDVIDMAPDSISGTEPFGFSWSPSFGLSDTEISNPELKGLKDTNLIYTLTVTDLNGCKIKDSLRVTTLKGLDIETFGDTVICQGVNTYLSAKGGIYYTWTPTTGIVGTNLRNRISVMPDITTQYKVEVNTNEECGFEEGFVTVTVNPLPTTVAPPDTFVCRGRTISLIASGADQYIWNATDTTDTLSVRILNYENTFWVTGYKDGCLGNTDTVIIRRNVNDSCSSKVFSVVNAFTPNGDLLNDSFLFKTYKIRSYQLTIFNRWGEQLFETNDPKAGWDGTFKGVKCPEGVYLFMVDAYGEDEEDRSSHGTFVLLY